MDALTSYYSIKIGERIVNTILFVVAPSAYLLRNIRKAEMKMNEKNSGKMSPINTANRDVEIENIRTLNRKLSLYSPRYFFILTNNN